MELPSESIGRIREFSEVLYKGPAHPSGRIEPVILPKSGTSELLFVSAGLVVAEQANASLPSPSLHIPSSSMYFFFLYLSFIIMI